MNSLLGVTCYRSLPPGEEMGAIFWHCGEKYYITQAEMDRIKNLPSAEEVRRQVALIEGLLKPKPVVR